MQYRGYMPTIPLAVMSQHMSLAQHIPTTNQGAVQHYIAASTSQLRCRSIFTNIIILVVPLVHYLDYKTEDVCGKISPTKNTYLDYTNMNQLICGLKVDDTHTGDTTPVSVETSEHWFYNQKQWWQVNPIVENQSIDGLAWI